MCLVDYYYYIRLYTVTMADHAGPAALDKPHKPHKPVKAADTVHPH